MNFLERVMRVMTHLNIGAALGLAIWVLWSGWQVVSGQISPGYRVAEVKALMSLPHAGGTAPLHLVPVEPAAAALPPCHTATPAPRQTALAMTGADL